MKTFMVLFVSNLKYSSWQERASLSRIVKRGLLMKIEIVKVFTRIQSWGIFSMILMEEKF